MKRLLFCLAIFLVAGPLSTTRAQSDPKLDTDPARWAPADALIFVGVTDVGQTVDNIKKTAAYRMSVDPTFGGASGAMPDFSKILQDRLAKVFDVAPAELTNPFAGPLAFYVTAPQGAKPDDVQVGFIAGVGDATAMRKYYDALLKKLKASSQHDTETVGPNTIDVFTADPAKSGTADKSPDSEFDALDQGTAPGLSMAGNPAKALESTIDDILKLDSLPPKFALCLTSDRLILAGTSAEIRAILEPETAGRTLADTDDYQDLLKNLRPLGNVRFVVNIPKLVRLATADADDAETTGRWLKTLDVDSLRSLVGHIRAGASSYDSKIEFLLLTRDAKAGLAKLLAMENRPIAPPPAVTSDTYAFFSLNVNPGQLLTDIQETVRTGDADSAEKMFAWLEKLPTGPDTAVNLRTEVFDNLAGPLMISLGMARPIDATSARTLIAVGHRDQTALAKVLTGFTGMFQPREIKGTPMFDAAFPPGNTIAVTSDRVLAGPTASVEAALEPPAGGTPLAETEAWKRAARVVPNEAWLTFYFDNRAALEAAQAYAKDAPPPNPLDFGALPMTSMLQNLQTMGVIEDKAKFRKLQKLSAQSIVTIATTPAGVQFTFVTTKPEE